MWRQNGAAKGPLAHPLFPDATHAPKLHEMTSLMVKATQSLRCSVSEPVRIVWPS